MADRQVLAGRGDSGQKSAVPVLPQLSRRQTGCLAFILVATGVIELWLGRQPICTCGRVKLWTGVVNGPENSQMVADWYSLSHVVHGLLFYLALHLVARRRPIGLRVVLAAVIEAGWEVLENSPVIIERYRSATAAVGYTGDSILNSLGDIVFMLIGFTLAGALPARVALALGLTLELISLAAIRDNLTLNVLMLLHPVEAIRVWQGG